ncbi:MAG TPA: cyanophycin synthetase, partial [Gammaproteobacteria bacterium]|nr:cyanophycin synthetase [Gammaproteobacteria bacterium]
AAVRAQAAGRVFVVFGCGGDRDRGKRSQMGAVAAGAADRLVLTNDNPRGEDPAAIVAEIRTGIPAGTEVAVIPDRSQAIAAALGEARAGDVVLVAGKGHEAVQVIGHERRRYSDRQTVERLLLGSLSW